MTDRTSRRRFLKYVGVGAAVAAAAAAGGYWYGLIAPKGKIVEKTIKIGHSSGITGVVAAAESLCAKWYNLWIEMVNAKGGIYVDEYGERLPVAFVLYDDMFSPEKYARNTRRLIEVDKVHVLLGSYGTAMSFAIDPVVNEYNIPCFASNAGPALIEKPEEFERIYLEKDYYRDEEGRPWYEWGNQFWSEMHYYWLAEALFDIMKDVGVSDCVLWEIGTLFGVENRRNLIRLLEYNGIDVLSHKIYPMDIKDFSGMISEAKRLDPDALLQFSYPYDCWLSTGQIIEADYNPKLFYNALGFFYEIGYKKFGKNVDGVLGHGDIFPGPMSKGRYGTGQELLAKYMERYMEVPDYIDGPIPFANCEVIETIIERAGTLDPEALHEELLKTKDDPIPTLNGPMKWHRGPWCERPGSMLQHIGYERGKSGKIVNVAMGEYADMGFEIDKGDWTEAKPIYPKPKWRK